MVLRAYNMLSGNKTALLAALFMSAAIFPAAATPDLAFGADPIDSIIFIDASVRDRAHFEQNLPAGSRLIVITSGADPFEQMAKAASGFAHLKSISILSHAIPGQIQFSAANFTTDDLNRRGEALATLSRNLAPDGDILLYGCDLGAGIDGRAFVDTLTALTGRDVAASSNATGAASLGGDWALEVASGPIAQSSLSTTNSAAGWNDLLAITVTPATSATQMRDAIGASAANGITYVGTPTLNAPVSSNAFGTFTTSGSTLGILSGAIIGTGNVAQVPGAPSYFWDGVGTGIAGSGNERDVAALSYQFTPNTGITKVVFQVVMGSEEYNEYVGQGFSDNIRILLSGGAYSNSNVALVPGTSTGIDIDTINASLNSAFYRDNTVASPPVPDSVLDGHTTVVNTVVAVVPGTTYTTTTTVADFIDNRYNTAAFLGFFGASINLDLDLNNSSGATGTSYNTSFSQGGAAIPVVDTDRTIRNYDTTSIQSATLTLTNAKSSDVLAVGALPAGITGTINTTTPGVITVTFTGASTAANYQSALSAVTFINTSAVPNTTLRNITVKVFDGTTDSNTAVTSITVVNITTPSGNEFCTGANLASNGGFELPAIAANTSANTFSMPGWSTSDPSGIEQWGNGYSGVPSHTANQFIELNGSGAYPVTQNSGTVHGRAQLDVYFAHHARIGTDTANLVISDNGSGSTNFGNFSSTTSSWSERSASHVVAATGTIAQLVFLPVSTGSGSAASGNLLDSIEICQTYITLDKTFLSKVDTVSDGRDSAGDTIFYRYSIANPAGNNRTLTSISFVDDKIGTVAVPTPLSGDTDSDGALDPGETWIAQASYILTQANIDAGTIANIAYARGSTTTNLLRSDDDTVTVPLNQIPTLSINKSIPPATVLPLTAGQRLDYLYEVTNTGNVTLSNVVVDDTHDGDNTPPVPDDEAIVTPTSGTSSDTTPSNGIWSTLAPGDKVRFTATYIVNQQDIDMLQ